LFFFSSEQKQEVLVNPGEFAARLELFSKSQGIDPTQKFPIFDPIVPLWWPSLSALGSSSLELWHREKLEHSSRTSPRKNS
jgi:hypothetical protein